MFKLDEEGFAVGGRARQYQRQHDTSLDALRTTLANEGRAARAAAKTIWLNGMNLINQINAEIEPKRDYTPVAYPAQEQAATEAAVKRPVKILDWGKNLKTPSQTVLDARAAQEQARLANAN